MDKNLDISQMEFDYIDVAACFLGNNQTNKSMSAISRTKIINALFQLEENIHKALRQLNAYDASSIIISESNWIKRNHFYKYMPSKKSPKKIKLGQVCTIDYGKTYKSEIGYIHPGLCVGKKDGKYLIIPMTTGDSWRSTCFHPLNNPNMTKENRQALYSEGFAKDGILLLNDAKFISGGRILDVHENINEDILKEIQEQLFFIMFPELYRHFETTNNHNVRLQNRVSNMESQIKNLTLKNEKLSKRILDLEEVKNLE